MSGWVRDQTSGRDVVAVPFKGQVFALGAVDDIRACFGANIKDRPQRTPLLAGNLRYEDGAITLLLREALIRSMVHATGVQSDGSRELWLTNSGRQERLDGETYSVFNSVYLTLRQVDTRTFLIMKPSLKVLTRTGEVCAARGSERPQTPHSRLPAQQGVQRRRKRMAPVAVCDRCCPEVVRVPAFLCLCLPVRDPQSTRLCRDLRSEKHARHHGAAALPAVAQATWDRNRRTPYAKLKARSPEV